MAYKRTTKKTGPISRRSVTHSTSGPSTYSHSTTSNGVTYTSTSKGGKYYMTRTQRFANGYVERKRIMSSSTKRGSRSNKDSGLGGGGILILGIIILLAMMFGG